MKYFVALSTGKDSEAALWWAYHNLPFDSWDVVFNDVDWDDEAVYKHLKYLESRIGKKFIIAKSKGFADKLTQDILDKIEQIFGKQNIFAEMVMAKKRFPSTKARFCTDELKAKPMIDFILDNVKEDCVIIQGVRAEESTARRLMKEKDEFFKFYFEPYGTDKSGKEKFHSYRKVDVIEHTNRYSVDILRPVLKLKHQDVFNIIFENHSPGNELYRAGFSSVGCYPCVMCRLSEIRIIATRSPERIKELEQLEELSGSTFFPPLFIPLRFCTKKAEIRVYREDLTKLFGTKSIKTKAGQSTMFDTVDKINPEEYLYQIYFKNDKIPVFLDEDDEEYILKTIKVPTVRDVVNYVIKNPNQTDFLPASGCVSVYNICEVEPTITK